MAGYQKVGDINIRRLEHVWLRKGDFFKCVLCGAITNRPPKCPTPEDWVAIRYEPLTDEERQLCPRLD